MYWDIPAIEGRSNKVHNFVVGDRGHVGGCGRRHQGTNARMRCQATAQMGAARQHAAEISDRASSNGKWREIIENDVRTRRALQQRVESQSHVEQRTAAAY